MFAMDGIGPLGPGKDQKEYVVVLRGPSRAGLEPNHRLIIPFHYEGRRVEVRVQTLFAEMGFQVPVAQELWLEIRGPGGDLPTAIEDYWRLGAVVGEILAVAANAHVGQLEVEVAYDATPGASIRDYFQQLLPQHLDNQARGVIRLMDMKASGELVHAIGFHPRGEEIRRAVHHYVTALSYWAVGLENRTLASLYVAVEALTHVIRDEYMRMHGLQDREALAAALGLGSQGKRDQRQRGNDVDGAVRLKLIFQGDHECYKEARSVSDGFEHGFMAFDEMRERAAAVRSRTAGYVRRAIIEAAGLTQEDAAVLLGARFAEPQDPRCMIRYLWGMLVGHGDQLAPQGTAYPFMGWRARVEDVAPDAAGGQHVHAVMSIDPHLAPGIRFVPTRYDEWQGPDRVMHYWRPDGTMRVVWPDGTEQIVPTGDAPGAAAPSAAGHDQPAGEG
jgi:hypothetical protein